jgi:NO-binding membrane sensor protein with MHYT domain
MIMSASSVAGEHTTHAIEHFSLGPSIPILAYTVAVVGSLVGLACTRQASLATEDGARWRWLAYASISIGGVAIWMMHFIAMLGMAIPGSLVRYDVGWTVASAALSIGATFLALLIVGPSVRPVQLAVGGLVMGLAVNVMHYAGMNAVRIQGDVDYDVWLVLASILIAVTAATVALWFTLVLQSLRMRFLGAIVMGVAVVGMHYTGMAAMSVDVVSGAPAPAGLQVFTFLFPVFVFGLLALIGPIVAVMMAPERGGARRGDDVFSDTILAPVGSSEGPAPGPRSHARR